MKKTMGECKGQKTVTLENSCGMTVTLCALGAGIVSISVPDKDGVVREVTKLPETGYGAYHGALIGRTAGRIENATFTIDGKTAKLDKNNFGVDNLHGGSAGFNNKLFGMKITDGIDHTDIEFTYRSPDGEGGYFGNVDVAVTYRVYDCENRMGIIFRAKPDCKTLLNLTNHVYFDMSGHQIPVADQYMYLNASRYGVLNERLIMEKVAEVPEQFDFRTPHLVRKYLSDDIVQKYTHGYDHPFVLDERGMDKIACSLYCDMTGILLEVRTTYPCVVVFGDNFENYASTCFECQYPPNGVNQGSDDCGVCDPEHPYYAEMEYTFSIK